MINDVKNTVIPIIKYKYTKYILLLVVVFISVILESFGFAMLFPLFEIIIGGETNHQLSKVLIYPLQLIRARNVVSKRFVLIGDAAHGIHPIAGQGFNLTIRGIKTLSELCQKRALVGLDIGSENFLREYEKIRETDIFSLVLATHNLNKLFSAKASSIRLLRRIGMSTIQKSPIIKKIFMRYAMGL